MKAEGRRKQWSPAYVEEVEQSLRNHLADLDALPISRITARIVAPILEAVELAAPAMEEKVSRRLHAIMDYAVQAGAIEVNPLPRRRRAKVERKHFPAVTDVKALGEILRNARRSDPCKGVQRAHQMLVYCAQRVSEVTGAHWSEFDLATGKWRLPRARMKRKDAPRGPHEVPLPPVLLAAMREWHKVDGKGALFVCPAPRDAKRHVTPEAIEKFHRDVLGLAGRHSPHSWRSSFSTIAREAGKDSDTIEAQLDHVVGTKVASAYDRAKRYALRRALLEWYESVLNVARDGAEVVRIKKNA